MRRTRLLLFDPERNSMSRSFSRVRAAAFALSCSISAVIYCAAAAAAEAQDESLETVLVVGQRDAPIEIAPRGLAVSLGAEQMAAVNAFNTEDLMKYAPNFFVRKRYSGDSNGVPGFRGTHSSQSARTLVMVDGFVVSNFLGNSFGFAPKWGVVGPSEVRQFDIVYGPYSSRYAGNSMGGIVNITTRDPVGNEAFTTVQGFSQGYSQFATDHDFHGYSTEAGFGWKQADGPFSLRLTGRYFRNDGQPMSWYGLTPVTGAPGTAVTGAVIDPEQQRTAAAGTGIANAPGTAINPIFAAQSPANITQEQAKLKLGYDDGRITGQLLLAFWHNEDLQDSPECYLRDSGGNAVCEGRVTLGSQTYAASGANWSKTLRDEFLAGVKLAAPLTDNTSARLALSTYQIARADGFSSNGYVAGAGDGAGKLARQGPTGWYTADLTVEHRDGPRELAVGFTTSEYRTDQTNFTLANWRSDAGSSFSTQTFGKTRSSGAWGEARLHLDALTLTAGIRHDAWKAFDGGLARLGSGAQAGQTVQNHYATRSKDTTTPSASAEYRFADGTIAQLSLAIAQRFPTVGELFQGSLNGDGTFNVNSFDPDLKPERSHDVNLLVGRNFRPVRLTSSVFYQRVRNTIFSFTGFNQNGATTSSYKNLDLTRQYGVELIAEAHDLVVHGLDLEINAAWLDSQTLRNAAAPAAEGVQFPRIPHWRINGNVRYDITPAVQGTMGLRYASRPNTDLFGLQRGDTFGFTSELFALDARVNWQATPTLRVSAGVDNLTNDRAWVYHPYPQRTWLLELGWRL
jgi:iron complex outermembrane recepter protein